MDSHLTKVLFYPLNWPQLLSEIPDDVNYNKLLVLSNRELSVILSVVNIVLKQPWSWGLKGDDPLWQDIQDFVAAIVEALMAVLNIDDLIKTNLMLWSAMTGVTIDRDHPETYLTGELEPASSVIAELDNIDDAVGALRIELKAQLESAVAQLVAIKDAIAAQSTGDPEQLADELEGIVNTIQTVATVLGALV